MAALKKSTTESSPWIKSFGPLALSNTVASKDASTFKMILNHANGPKRDPFPNGILTDIVSNSSFLQALNESGVDVATLKTKVRDMYRLLKSYAHQFNNANEFGMLLFKHKYLLR